MSVSISEISYLVLGSVLLLGSGFGILGLVASLRRALTGIESIPCALLLSSGVTGLWALAGRVAGLRIEAWSIGLLVVSLSLLPAGLIARWRRRGESRAEPEPGWHRGALLALAALAFALMVRDGGSLGPIHDSLDFVAFVNETLQTGDLAPDSPIYDAEPGIPPDPRRGSFHTQVSALCYLTGTTPPDAWRWLPRLLAPLAVLGIGAMFRPWLGAGAAVLATALFIATTFFTFDRFIQNLGYASRFGWICGWAALLALGQGLALRARARWRESNALLALAAVAPAILLFVHILSGFQVLLALGCAGLAVWSCRGSGYETSRAVWFVLVTGGLLLVPVVIGRLAQSMAVDNLLFDHVYGVVFVAPGWPILHPDYLFERFGIAGIAGAVLAIGLLPAIRRSRVAGFLAWSTLIPLLILFFPPIVRLVVAAHAHSMLFRVLLTIPFAGTLAWCGIEAVRNLRGPAAWRRLRGALVLGAVAAALVGQTMATRSEWTVPEQRRATHRESEPLLHALEFLDRRFPEVRTVLSDPISSYAIPAYTRHDAVAPFHQHSSPADPSVPARIRDVQEALNGRVGLERTVRILRRYHVDLILVNQSYPRFQSFYYVFVSPLAYQEQAAKFASAPDLFEKVYEAEGITIFAVHDPGPDRTVEGDPPNPDRIPDPGTPALLTSRAVELIGFHVSPGPYRPEEPIPFALIWRRTDAPYALPTVCEIKVQHTIRPRGYETPVIGRLSRWWDERRAGTTLRFGRPFRPLVTFYPDFLWAPGETFRDVHWEHIPGNARAGVYEIWVRLGVEPYAKVANLSELLSNHLGEGWIRLGEIEVAR